MASYRDFLPAVASGGGWQRPSDWLALPTVTSAEQKFVGLHAVFPDGDNVCALLLTTSAGQYEVDWGDGTVTLHNSNTKAEHQYDYSTISASTDTTRGYRQVLVTVTPVSGNILTINFQQRYTDRNQPYATGWLDVIGSFPNASSGLSVVFGDDSQLTHGMVERVTWLTLGAATSMQEMFRNCFSLQVVTLFDTSLITNMQQTFFYCVSLIEVPLFNTANVTNMISMFNQCYNIRYLPLLDTSNVTSMVQMFNGCFNLINTPLFNTGLVDTMNAMFVNCHSLRSIPSLSTTSITTTSGSDYGNFALNAYSLQRCEMVFARTVSFGNANLSRTALVEIFNNLVDRSLTTSATITITNNWGAALLTAGERAIATGKNWTITG
jgi:surface protein